jgi:hypothetical protein
VIAEDENLELAAEQGFATYECDNSQLGRKINHGYELAGREGVEFMVPFGSDDWIDHKWIRLPADGETVATHWSTVVNEDCTRLALLNIRFGDGVRIFPRSTLEPVGFRPAGEDLNRAIDTSTHIGVNGAAAPRLVFHDTHALCIVDFKSPANLNDYNGCLSHYGGQNETADVWGLLGQVYPEDAIREMQAVHVAVGA